MKTGRLLKFHRPAGDVQAYVYHDGGRFHAALYLLSATASRESEPLRTFSGRTEAEVEEAVRTWVADHFPRN